MRSWPVQPRAVWSIPFVVVVALSSGHDQSMAGRILPGRPLAGRAVSPIAIAGPDKAAVDRSGSSTFDFGPVDSLRSPTIEHVFVLRNESTHTLVLGRVATSCGCTVVFWLPASPSPIRSAHGGNVADGERFLKAGETAALRVSVDTTQLRSGATNKLVWLYAHGPPAPLITLEVKMDVSCPVEFDREVLDFGKVTRNTTAERVITVSFAPGLVDDKRVFLVSTDSRIIVSPESVGLGVRSATTGRQPANGKSERHYRIQLRAHGVLGPVAANLRVFRVSPPGALRTVGNLNVRPLRAPTLIGRAVTVIGEITGPMAAVPEAVLIPVVQQGRDVTRAVELDADPGVLAELKVKAQDPSVSAVIVPLIRSVPTSAPNLQPPGKNGSGWPPCATVLVTLSTRTLSIGLFNSEVFLTTKTGTRLRIPIRAMIQSLETPR